MVDEVEWILDRYHPEMLWLADDVFTIHHGWLVEYAAEMKRRGLRDPVRVHHARRPPERARGRSSLRNWAASACGSAPRAARNGSWMPWSAASRSQQVRDAVALCSSTNGIHTGMFLMWGYEGEELSDIEATYEHVKACSPDVFFTTVSYPIKGTPYYDEVAPKLVQLGPWQATTDRDIKIRGRRSRRFYQLADQLLRSRDTR